MKNLIKNIAIAMLLSFSFQNVNGQGFGVNINLPTSMLHVVPTTLTGVGINMAANTITTGTGQILTINGITSGIGNEVSSTSIAFTGTLSSITLTGNSATNTGTIFKVTNAGTLNTGTTAMITNKSSGISFRVNDTSSDADPTPFVVDAAGKTGVGIPAPISILHIYQNNASTSTTAGLTIEQGSTGDAVAQYLLSGGQRWVTGVDNSDGDKFKIASTANLNTNTRFTIQTTGEVGIGTLIPTSLLHLAPATAALASFRVEAGVQPTTPNTGELYADGTNIFYYNGTGWDDLTVTGGTSYWARGTVPGKLYPSTLTDFLGLGTNTPTSILDITTAETTGIGVNLNMNTITTGSALTLLTNGLTTGNGFDLSSTSAIVAGGNLANLTANAATTGTLLNITGNALTAGTGISVNSASVAYTGTLANITLSGSNAANSGTILKASNIGALNTGTAVIFTNLGTGISLQVNDETGDADATPFVIDASGSIGIGTSTPTEKMHLYRNQTTNPGDVAIRHETTATAGTAAIAAGPLSGTSSNLAGVGTIPWATPTNADASDNNYATSTKGTSNYLYSNIPFSVPATATINSINIEVEKSYTNNPVSILDSWITYDDATIPGSRTVNYTASAGTNRILIVAMTQTNKNGKVETMGSVTFGGQALTKINNTTQNSTDDSSLEIWYLNEAGIVAAGAGAKVLDMSNWSNTGNLEDEIYAIATYQYVDQTTPISAQGSTVTNGKVQSLQLGAALAVSNGDLMLAVGAQADNKSFDVVPTGFTELFDITTNNNRGATLGMNSKSITATGTEQPTVTGQSGNNEEMHISGIVINNGFGNTTDNIVSLYSGGALIGANVASVAAWTTSDTYTAYAGVATAAQINVADFGLVVSTTVAGTHVTSQVDHVRISITYTNAVGGAVEYTTGLDISAGTYVIAASSSLGTNDILRMSPGNICYTGSLTACSDKRFKKNFSPLKNSLDNLLKIDGLSYYWRINEFPSKSFTTDKQIGFIAQEIEPLYPELVRTDSEGYKSVEYAKFTPILVEAIKELNQKIENLQTQNNQLAIELASYKKLNEEVLKMSDLLNTLKAEIGTYNISEK